jgi:hypothetical protein
VFFLSFFVVGAFSAHIVGRSRAQLIGERERERGGGKGEREKTYVASLRRVL